MGNSNTLIDITFDRTQPTIYYTGDTISGQVHFTISERTTTVEYIFLTVTGDVGYTTTHTTRMPNGLSKQITDRHDIRIFGEKVLLGHAQQHGSTSRRSDTTILEPGRYTYPFSVCLPDVLPPTIHPKDYPFVRYELQLFIEKKWYSSNSRHHYPLRIHPRINLLQISNSQCAVRFDTRHKDITVNGVIQRSGLVPGEQTTISVEIHNPSHLAIKRVDVCLIQRYDIEQCRRRLELTRLSIPQLLNSDDGHIQATCSITIPMGTPPSYNYRSRAGRSMVHVNIHYDIKLEVKAKGLFSDFGLQVPITIGTDPENLPSYIDAAAPVASTMNLDAIDMLEVEVDDDESFSRS